MLVLATDQLELYGNEIHDNDTTGLAVVNFALADPAQPDPKYDFFPEGLYIHDNRFRDNGGNPQEPNLERGEATLLPLLLRIKNLGRSAHIVWDGAVDQPNDCEEVPVDADGVALTSPNPNEGDRHEARTDERGRPNFQRGDPNPKCKWTRWKFTDSGRLKRPENGLCIAGNSFSNTRLETALTTDFLNGNVTTSDPATLVQDLLLKPATTDLAPHRCTLPSLATPSLALPFPPNPAGDDAPPTEEETRAACQAPANDEVNWSAALRFDCPRLDAYGLFADPEDPRREPNGDGVPFELQSALFSDYALKYRFLFLPPGTQATYRDHETSPTATFDFPVGTIIAKTFSFKSGAEENVVETRLLIKRETAQGVSWVGRPYVWTSAPDGSRVADLRLEGATASVAYDYDDPDPEVGGNRHYQGVVERYGIPASLNCITCHGGDDREAGAAPIGLKPRNLNRPVRTSGETEKNQLELLAERGVLEGLPADLAKVERLPRWNVPGDSGKQADSAADVHDRARAYLEVNCMHCHNPAGGASNSGLFLDAFRAVDVSYGICKKPVAAGKGSGDRRYDIVPGSAEDSILTFRVGSAEPGIRMPPLSRTVVHEEAAELLTRWIDDVLPTSDTQNEEACTGALAGLPIESPIPLPGLPRP